MIKSKITITTNRSNGRIKNSKRTATCCFIPSMTICTIVLCSSLFLPYVKATGITCTNNEECEGLIQRHSFCMESGFCSNPFHNKGCLANLLPKNNSNGNTTTHPYYSKEYIRICTSADPPEAEALGYCRSAKQWNYTEIRLLANDWESSFFETWIMQIILTELLGVPVSVESGKANTIVDFYDINSRIEYGKPFDWEAMKRANAIKDCTQIHQRQLTNDKTNEEEDTYQSCGHVMIEWWKTNSYGNMVVDGILEKPSALGILGYEGWHIPKRTVEKDPSLKSYFGLVGAENRYKLAETFLTPTKWIDYCEQVSSTNCSEPDGVAQRAPENDEERQKMFAGSDLYIGHFRKTLENDCEINPFTCTGHVADYPCGWASLIQAQAYHLNIPLRSSGDEPNCNGYAYSQLTEIWDAANATQSDVMMYWWSPHQFQQKYIGTDYEFQVVSMPIPTEECIAHRPDMSLRCSDNLQDRIGSPLGVCDEDPQSLKKIVVSSFYDICNDPDQPVAMHNPAYDVIQNFEISNLEINALLKSWVDKKFDVYNYDPRLAVCEWVVEHLDDYIIPNIIPDKFPRIMQDGENTFTSPLFYISLVFACIVLILITGTSTLVYKLRKRRIMVLAQIEFLYFLLIGLILVQIGSLILSIPPSNASCILATWCINLGYTVELVPLIVKVAAINKLMAAARQMKRVKLDRRHLLAIVACLTSMIAVYLMIWTILDPRHQETYYELTNDMNTYNETIVNVYTYCSSDHLYWGLTSLTWRCILLLWATVLAFQTRKSPVNINESKTLAIMIYSQFIFVVWSLILFIMEDSNVLQVSSVARYQSLVLSADVLAVCCIYFVPKLLTTDAHVAAMRHSTITSSVYVPSADQTNISHQRSVTSSVADVISGRDSQAPCQHGSGFFVKTSDTASVLESGGTIDTRMKDLTVSNLPESMPESAPIKLQEEVIHQQAFDLETNQDDMHDTTENHSCHDNIERVAAMLDGLRKN